jgi:hypothetical protein
MEVHDGRRVVGLSSVAGATVEKELMMAGEGRVVHI